MSLDFGRVSDRVIFRVRLTARAIIRVRDRVMVRVWDRVRLRVRVRVRLTFTFKVSDRIIVCSGFG